MAKVCLLSSACLSSHNHVTTPELMAVRDDLVSLKLVGTLHFGHAMAEAVGHGPLSQV